MNLKKNQLLETYYYEIKTGLFTKTYSFLIEYTSDFKSSNKRFDICPSLSTKIFPASAGFFV